MKRRQFIGSSLMTAGALAFSPRLTRAMEGAVLPKVVLLGDSIRMGYRDFAERELKGRATIWAPEENCRTSDYIIYHLHAWIRQQQPDLVHMNAGLHDIRTLSYHAKAGETIVKPGHYRDNLETIFKWVREEVGCKIIWATTTPVIDEKVKARKGSFTRYDADVRHINRIALQAARKYHVPINDLYTFAREEIGEAGMKKDGVHFREEASEMLGIKVAERILEVL